MLLISIDSRPYLIIEEFEGTNIIISLDAIAHALATSGTGTITGALSALNEKRISFFEMTHGTPESFYKEKKNFLVITRPGLAPLRIPAKQIACLDGLQLNRFDFLPEDHSFLTEYCEILEERNPRLTLVTFDDYMQEQLPIELCQQTKDSVIFKLYKDKEKLKYSLTFKADGSPSIGVV